MKKLQLSYPPWTLILFSIILLSGCGIQPKLPRTVMTSTNPNIPKDLLLPAPLFYLFQGQIWQLSIDGRNTTQITNEIDPVTAFDVSPSTDSLVYVSGNHLILSQGDGSQRKVLRQGIELRNDTDLLEHLNNLDWIEHGISSPLFSSDGRKIAFIENGLKNFNIENETFEVIWKYPDDLQEVFYRLISWSPDDEKYLISTYVYPSQSVYQQSIAVLNFETLVTVGKQSVYGFSWFDGGNGLILSDSVFAHADSLMRCELNRFNCVQIAEFEPGRWYYAYAMPMVLNRDTIYIFMSAVSDPGYTPKVFKLVQMNLEGRNRTNLMVGEFPIEHGLWYNDGRGVIIQLSQDMQSYEAGTVLWLDLIHKKIFELPMTNISQMKWGMKEDS